MVSQLPKKDQLLDISENENIKSTPATSSRKTVKHVIPKKSPVRKVSKTKVSFNYLYFTGYKTEFKFSIISNNIIYVYQFFNRKLF